MEINLSFDYREEDLSGLPLEDLARFVLNQEDVPDNAVVSVSFVDDGEMADLNEQYRGKTGPTDVLSFEAFEDDDEDFFGFDEAELADTVDEYELGDIIIAPDTAQRQCALYGTSFEGEISLLMVHGLLHLAGYDHIEDDEAEVMEARESELLAAWVAADTSRRLEDYGESFEHPNHKDD